MSVDRDRARRLLRAVSGWFDEQLEPSNPDELRELRARVREQEGQLAEWRRQRVRLTTMVDNVIQRNTQLSKMLAPFGHWRSDDDPCAGCRVCAAQEDDDVDGGREPHRYCGSSAARESAGDPGHCEDCCSVGHVVAHPDLSCGDVGCYATHNDEDVDDDVTEEELRVPPNASDAPRTFDLSVLRKRKLDAVRRVVERYPDTGVTKEVLAVLDDDDDDDGPDYAPTLRAAFNRPRAYRRASEPRIDASGAAVVGHGTGDGSHDGPLYALLPTDWPRQIEYALRDVPVMQLNSRAQLVNDLLSLIDEWIDDAELTELTEHAKRVQQRDAHRQAQRVTGAAEPAAEPCD